MDDSRGQRSLNAAARILEAAGDAALHEGPAPRVNVQGHGQSAGIPADANFDEHSFNPMGNPGREHWQASTITGPGLEDRSSLFFAVVEMTRMPMLICDATQDDHPIAFANRAFLDLSGMREEDLIGRNPRLLQGPDTDPETVAEIRQAVREGRACAVELVNYKADGTPFWNALFLGPVFDADGRLRYWFASQVDVSDRRKTQQTLLQAQKLEAIGQLTAGMAHDFNNLLHVVLGNIEVAKRLARKPDAADALCAALGRAERAAMKGGKLNQQLLSFARKQRLEPRDINLNALVVEFSEMLVRTLGAQVDLRLDLKPGLPNCRLDPVHLEMALLNVLINARDAMPDGGRVTVGTSLADESGPHHAMGEQGCVALCVRDEGEGMPEHVRRRAMEPFFTTKSIGTGLGLAMVHGFVQQSHGRLEIDSEAGRGTTVRLLFPLGRPSAAAASGGGADLRHDPDVTAERGKHDGAATADGAAGAKAPARDAANQPIAPVAPAATGRVHDRPLIWIVEDSEDVRDLCEEALRGLGCRVVTSGSGDEALSQLEQRRGAALLLTDVKMPGRTDGRALARKVREASPSTEILLMTGFADALTEPERQEPYPVLNKPFQAEELRQRVSEALRERWQEHA